MTTDGRTKFGLPWHGQAHILQLWQSGEGDPQDLIHCRQAELISCDKEVQEHGVQGLQEGGPQHSHTHTHTIHSCDCMVYTHEVAMN